MEIITFSQIAQLFISLAFVVALMGGLAFVIKRLGLSNTAPVHKGEKRIKIVESQALDARRRLVLVQCDDKQHLVMCGINGETVIKTDIEPPSEPKDAPKKSSAKT